MKMWKGGAQPDRKYAKPRNTTYADVNELAWEWFCAARAKNIPVSGKMLQEKAVQLAAATGYADF